MFMSTIFVGCIMIAMVVLIPDPEDTSEDCDEWWF
jgi:hypothetical protein